MTFSAKPNSHAGKIVCNECGATGYRGGRWMVKCGHHTTCDCGKVVPTANLGYHFRHCPLRKPVG